MNYFEENTIGDNEPFDLETLLDDNQTEQNPTIAVSTIVQNLNSKTQYQHDYVSMEEVFNDPNEYIIPECIQACQSLWSKNIETFMTSNYDDDHLYVLFIGLSEVNRDTFRKLMKKFPEHYCFDEYRKTCCIKVNGMTEADGQNLTILTAPFKMQDTFRFKSEESFLDDFKKTDGPLSLDSAGFIKINYNPEYNNATLQDALAALESPELYVPSEKRIYDSEFFKAWHDRYLEINKTATQPNVSSGEILDFNPGIKLFNTSKTSSTQEPDEKV